MDGTKGVSALYPDQAPLYDLRVWIESNTETTLAASFERGTRLRLKTEFAADSPLEGDGFELPVPRAMQARLEAKIAGFGCMFAVDYLRLPSVAIS